MKGNLYLIPSPISEQASLPTALGYLSDVIKTITCFFVEHEGKARSFLREACPSVDFGCCEFVVFDEHKKFSDIKATCETHLGKNMGIITEAGCPAVADPGAEIVFWAQRNGVKVIPLVGPSSILLALMASGLNGQNFAFVGYLPKERQARIQKIKMLEERSRTEKQTQVFMEAPYHNQKLFEEIVATCHPQTLLCVAADLTGIEEFIRTQAISEWKGIVPPIHKRPTLFLILRQQAPICSTQR
jgi:16S rRNA (cytidine1402-2'-O)-methyltransferase